MISGQALYRVQIDNLRDPFAKAIGHQRRYLMNPRSSLDLIRYAALLSVNRQFEEAMSWLDKVLADEPDNAMALHQKAIILLTNGDWPNGLPMYEARFRAAEDSFRGPKLAMWDGQPTERPVILWQEGGFGDAILPARWIPEVAKRCPNTFLFVDKGLRSLFDSSELTRCVSLKATPEQQAYLDRGEAYQCALMSLPYVLGITLDTLDGKLFLRAPRDEVMRWRKKLDGKAKIGFCWCGNPTWERDVTRSMPLDIAKQLEKIIDVMPLLPELTGAEDWMDTAAIISNLDLVISTCTAIAHCAAALGKPTWLLLSYDSDWRWGREFVKYPRWYNSMQAFRCPSHGDWMAVIKAVYQNLRWGLSGLSATANELQ